MPPESVSEKAAKRARARETEQRKKQLIIFAVCAVAIFGLWMVFGPEGGDEGVEGAGGAGLAGDGGEQLVEGVPLNDLLERGQAPRLSEEEQVRATIEQHAQDVAANPDDEMNPSKLNAAGNLHKQLGEYEEAAQKYELLLLDYPDWEGRKRVYPNLISCYEELGQQEDVLRICEEMMAFFPADSNEYEWARDRLGMAPLSPEEVEAAVAETEAEAAEQP